MAQRKTKGNGRTFNVAEIPDDLFQRIRVLKAKLGCEKSIDLLEKMVEATEKLEV